MIYKTFYILLLAAAMNLAGMDMQVSERIYWGAMIDAKPGTITELEPITEFPEKTGWPEIITFDYLKKIGAWYPVMPAYDAPLDEALVMNPFWQKLKQIGDQDFLNQALVKIGLQESGLYNHLSGNLKRYQIIAACYAGADPNMIAKNESSKNKNVLCLALSLNDYDLARSLLSHKVDPNYLQNHFRSSLPLHHAKTVKMAQLLIDHGADVQKANNVYSLIHNVIYRKHEPKLIELYCSNGCELRQTHRNGQTASMFLCEIMPSKFHHYFIELVNLGVSKEEWRDAIDKVHDSKLDRNEIRTVLAFIKTNNLDFMKANDNEKESCSVCLEELSNQSAVSIPCRNKHTDRLCLECLNKLNRCPLCRSALI